MKNIIKKATRDQIIEIVRQLGNGEMSEGFTQAVIEHRFKPSGLSIRETQARRLYDLKFGDVLGCQSFEKYFDGTDSVEAVPQITVFPETHVRLFGRENVWLVDGRVAEQVGIKEYCKLLGLVYTGEDDTLEACDLKRAKSGVRWMIGQDGFRNRGRKGNECRELFQTFEVGMDSVEGGAVYAQNSKVIYGHWMNLLGSVRREGRESCVCLGVFDDKPGLDWDWDGCAYPQYGSASRGE